MSIINSPPWSVPKCFGFLPSAKVDFMTWRTTFQVFVLSGLNPNNMKTHQSGLALVCLFFTLLPSLYLSSADLRFPFFSVHFIQSIFRIGMTDQGCSIIKSGISPTLIWIAHLGEKHKGGPNLSITVYRIKVPHTHTHTPNINNNNIINTLKIYSRFPWILKCSHNTGFSLSTNKLWHFSLY